MEERATETVIGPEGGARSWTAGGDADGSGVAIGVCCYGIEDAVRIDKEEDALPR